MKLGDLFFKCNLQQQTTTHKLKFVEGTWLAGQFVELSNHIAATWLAGQVMAMGLVTLCLPSLHTMDPNV